MAVAGTIAVNVVANLGGFAAGLKRAQGSLATFGQNLTPSIGGVGKFSAGMIGLGSVAAVASVAIYKLAAAFSHLDEVSKLSKQLGTSVNELLRLQGIAAQTDVSLETLERGMNRLARTIGEARAGVTMAKDALAELGLSADNLANMSPEKALAQVADAIQRLPTAADQAAAAVSVFGKSGADMLPMLQGGAEGLDKMGERYHELAGTLSGFGQNAISDANDAFDEMKIAGEGFANAALTVVAPALLYTFQALTNVAIAAREVTDSFLRFLGVNLAPKIDSATIGGSKEAASAFWEEQRKKAEEAAKAAAKFASEMQKIRDRQQSQANSIRDEFRNPAEKYAARIRELNELLAVGALKWEFYQRATAAARAELDAAVANENKLKNDRGNQSAGALTRGSTAAFQAIQSSRNQANKQAEIAKQQLATEKKIAEILTAIKDANINGVVVNEVGL